MHDDRVRRSLYPDTAENTAFREVAFALPVTFTPADCTPVLTDMATRLGPALGWHPSH